MKIKEGFVLRTVMGKTVAVAVGPLSKSFRGMIKLNDTARDIWRGIEDGLDETGVADKLCQTYAVTEEKALDDVRKMISLLRDNGVIEDE